MLIALSQCCCGSGGNGAFHEGPRTAAHFGPSLHTTLPDLLSTLLWIQSFVLAQPQIH